MIMILRESFRERDKSLVSVIERIMIIHPAKTKEWGLIKRIPLQGLACLFQTKLGPWCFLLGVYWGLKGVTGAKAISNGVLRKPQGVLQAGRRCYRRLTWRCYRALWGVTTIAMMKTPMTEACLILVASISGGAGVKKNWLRVIFFTVNAKRTPDRNILCDVILCV